MQQHDEHMPRSNCYLLERRVRETSEFTIQISPTFHIMRFSKGIISGLSRNSACTGSAVWSWKTGICCAVGCLGCKQGQNLISNPCTGVKLFMMSKVLCMFSFEICTPRGEGEKRE